MATTNGSSRSETPIPHRPDDASAAPAQFIAEQRKRLEEPAPQRDIHEESQEAGSISVERIDEVTTSHDVWPSDEQISGGQRQRYLSQLEVALHEGWIDLAISAAEKLVAIESKTLESSHPDLVCHTQTLAGLYESKAEFSKAVPLREAILAAASKLHGEDHWLVTDARLALDNASLMSRIASPDRGRLKEARRLSLEAEELYDKDQFERAAGVWAKILQVEGELLGRKHPTSIQTSASLFRALDLAGQTSSANDLLQHTLETAQEVFGPQHPQVASLLNTRGWHLHLAGNDTGALHSLLAAQKIYGQALGQTNATYAQVLHNLALVNDSLGKTGCAERQYRRALLIRKMVLGEDDLDYAHTLNNLAAIYQRQGAYDEAEDLCSRVLSIRREHLGRENPEYTSALYGLATVCTNLEDHERAVRLWGELLELYGRMPNTPDSLIAEAQANKDTVLTIQRLSTAERKHLYAAFETLTTAKDLAAQGRPKEALEQLKPVTEVLGEALGKAHPAYVDALSQMAQIHLELTNYEDAEAICKTVVELRRKNDDLAGTKLAADLNALGLAGYWRGKYRDAEVAWLEAMDIHEHQGGRDRSGSLDVIGLLGRLYETMGDLGKAEQFLLRYQDLALEQFGEYSSQHGQSLNNLVRLYSRLGLHRKALQAKLREIEIQESIADVRQGLYPMNLRDLALIYTRLGGNEEAESLLSEATDQYKEELGAESFFLAEMLDVSIDLRIQAGRLSDAESALLELCDMRRKAKGESHPEYADALKWLGSLYYRMGDFEKARAYAENSLTIKLQVADATVPWLSEARASQLPWSGRSERNLLLSVLRRSDDNPNIAATAYSAVWRTKALITRALFERRQLLDELPEVRGLFGQLRDTQSELSQLTLATTSKARREVRQSRLSALSQKKELLESKLAELSVEFRGTLRAHKTGLAELAAILPDRIAIVDILTSWDWICPPDPGGCFGFERHYDAFVVRPSTKKPGYTVTWVKLGPADTIDEEIAEWRAMMNEGGRVMEMSDKETPDSSSQTLATLPGTQLRKDLWSPIEEHLEGCDTIVVLPDGDLNYLPWSALPGRREGTYLIEDYAISTASHGQQLCRLITSDQVTPGGLLLVGGVSYEERTSTDLPEAAVSGATKPHWAGQTRPPAFNDRPKWNYLDGTEKEIDAIASLWGASRPVNRLIGASPGESVLCQSMPACRFIHLATHGFFADEGFRSLFQQDQGAEQIYGQGRQMLTSDMANVTYRNPLILSGVVTAGANLPPPSDSDGLPAGEDGILTAEEIVSLDLGNTELAVLSACQTGLGRVAGGEGVMGLQRAFHLAGTRSVVASLWKVDDDATKALMVEFYRNLWDRQLGKLEALRQAQLKMMHEYNPATGQFRGGGVPRPVDPRELAKAKEMKAQEREALSPFYWAAFQLSGDWR